MLTAFAGEGAVVVVDHRDARAHDAPETGTTLSLPRRGRYRMSVPAGRTTSQVPPCVSTFWHLTSPAFSCA
jgi:hypothetical protein